MKCVNTHSTAQISHSYTNTKPSIQVQMIRIEKKEKKWLRGINNFFFFILSQQMGEEIKCNKNVYKFITVEGFFLLFFVCLQ